MSALSKHTMQSLAFVKYLFKKAVEESHKPEPFCTTAILGFHDSVEFFNELAAVHLGDQRTYHNFMDYWDMKLPDGGKLGHAQAMKKLNRLRTGLKHSGIFVRKEEVEDLRPLVEVFFEENTPRVFGIDFATISMVDLVHDEVVHAQLGGAEKLIADGDLPAAMGEISIAYIRTMRVFDNGPARDLHAPRFPGAGHHGLAFYYDGQVTSPDTDHILRTVGRQMDSIRDEMEVMHDILKLLILGIDHKDRLRFAKRTPHVANYVLANVPEGGYDIRHREGRIYTLEECHFCLNFVIECAVSIQNFLAE